MSDLSESQTDTISLSINFAKSNIWSCRTLSKILEKHINAVTLGDS